MRPRRRYPFAEFERFAESAPQSVQEKELAKVRIPSGKELTPTRLNKLGDYINASAVAEVGKRSEPDFYLCRYAITQGLDKEEGSAQVQGVSKFADRGRPYFDLTWGEAEKRVRLRLYRRAQRKTGKGREPSANGTTHALQGAPGRPALPKIQGNMRQLRDVTEEAMGALIAANKPPAIFQRGEFLTRLRPSEGDVAPSLEPLGDAALRGVLARAANWVVERHTKTGVVEEEDAPPLEVVRDLGSRPGWPGIPPIKAVVECPILDRKGQLVIMPGYHPDAQIYYHPDPGLVIPQVPVNPTDGDITRARETLVTDLMGDFPFRDDASRACALTPLLERLAREMIEGPMPLRLYDAPTEGTGKTLLVDCVTIAITGRPAQVMAEGDRDEEWRKRITAILIKAPPAVLIDNINRILDSGALAAVLTSTTWEDRLLTRSKMITLPNLSSWLATGNNVKMSRELVRRTVWCRLDAKVDAPWERTGFRHPDLRKWAKTNRGKLVWAGLVLCRAWVVRGRPPGSARLGGFEAWAEVLGGILEVGGIPGFLSNADEFRKTHTDRTEEWRAFITIWWQRYASQPMGVADLFTLVTAEKLLDEVLGDKGERSQRTRLGKAPARRQTGCSVIFASSPPQRTTAGGGELSSWQTCLQPGQKPRIPPTKRSHRTSGHADESGRDRIRLHTFRIRWGPRMQPCSGGKAQPWKSL